MNKNTTLHHHTKTPNPTTHFGKFGKFDTGLGNMKIC